MGLEELRHKPLQLLPMQMIVHSQPIFPERNQAGVFQDPIMVGQCWLAFMEDAIKITAPQLLISHQHYYNLVASGICQGLKDLHRRLGELVIHAYPHGPISTFLEALNHNSTVADICQVPREAQKHRPGPWLDRNSPSLAIAQFSSSFRPEANKKALTERQRPY
jgi:hypothetical protein